MKVKIGKTYTRKIQDKNYGGQQYESTDVGCWIEQEFEVDEEQREQQISSVSKLLELFVHNEVDKQIRERKKELEKEINKPPFSEQFNQSESGLLEPK